MGISASSSHCECQAKNPLCEFNSLDSEEMKILIPKSNSFDECDNTIYPLTNTQQDQFDCYKLTQRRRTISTTNPTITTPITAPEISICKTCHKRKINSSSPPPIQTPPHHHFEEVSSPKSSKTPKKLTFSIPNPVKIFNSALNSDCNSSPTSVTGNSRLFTTPSKRDPPPQNPTLGVARNRTRRGSTPGREESVTDLEKLKQDTRSRSRSSPQPNKNMTGANPTCKSLDSKEYVSRVNRVRTNGSHSDSDEEKSNLPPLKNSPKKMINEEDGVVVIGFTNTNGSSTISNATTVTITTANNSENINSSPTNASNEKEIDFAISVPHYKQPLAKITIPKSTSHSCPMNAVPTTIKETNKDLKEVHGNCRAISPLDVFRTINNSSRSDLILKKKNRPAIVPEEQDKDIDVLITANKSIQPRPRGGKQFNLFKFKSDVPHGNEKVLTQIKYHQSTPKLDSPESTKIVVDLNGAAPNVGGKKLPIYVIPPTSPSKISQNQRSKGVTLTEEKKRKLGSSRRASTTKKKTSKKMFSW
ncbi:predicted protein [Naegleria gruberi]|uniref:Predicted protein n=1 Tax=Naegleria gruberi TaxID=5762 RepID=D2VLM7_NAEGR|nr:uncharacterized protein NAEGRDRAFT_69836 [Naegleria gruberi]EFC42419.1 predicted protein [Naegleria gruberi]|eukprot:XP_002675163.1 predicted protein [Naegleria gruberi strain NEG-M]